MTACLNPSGSHPALETAQMHPVCSKPNCGFLLAGAIIERWQIHTLLKRGPDADLYLATPQTEETTEHEAKILIKVLHTFVAGTLSQVERLLTLHHSFIHPLLSVGWTGGRDGKIYLISQYEERGSLAYYLNTPTGLSPLILANLIYQAAEALQYAHERKVVHGRLKPENCLLVAPQTLHVCDWHRQILPNDTLEATSLYTAPEQMIGH
jgi:serine/threonine protein kinase